MSAISRRTFLKDSALLAAMAGTGLAEPTRAAEQPTTTGSANDRLRVAVVGVRGRGMSHVGGFAEKHNCVVTVVCDADEAVIGPAMRHVEKAQGLAPRF